MLNGKLYIHHSCACMRACVRACAVLRMGLCEYVIVHTILGDSPIILWILLGGKPKWLPLNIGYHDVMRTSPIMISTNSVLGTKIRLEPGMMRKVLACLEYL